MFTPKKLGFYQAVHAGCYLSRDEHNHIDWLPRIFARSILSTVVHNLCIAMYFNE